LISPRAVSISNSISTGSLREPVASVIQSLIFATSATASAFGMMKASSRRIPPSRPISSWIDGLSIAFSRTATVLLPQSCAASAKAAASSAAAFSAGGTASSRSRNTASAADAAAFCTRRARCAGAAR
jgi:hypothetical protein